MQQSFIMIIITMALIFCWTCSQQFSKELSTSIKVITAGFGVLVVLIISKLIFYVSDDMYFSESQFYILTCMLWLIAGVIFICGFYSLNKSLTVYRNNKLKSWPKIRLKKLQK